jgi:general secretion pathway protein G
MIELVFVIVILGVLAAVAIPRFAASRDDANLAKAKATVAAVRLGIVNERQSRLFRGDNAFINKLHHGTTVLFDHNGTSTNSIMMYGVTTRSGNGYWQPSASLSGGNWQYKYRIFNEDQVFEYNPNTGTFNCVTGSQCSILTN